MRADANRTLPFSSDVSRLLRYPYPSLTEGAAEPGNGGTPEALCSVGLSLLLSWLQVRIFGSLLLSLEGCLGSLTPLTNNTVLF